MGLLALMLGVGLSACSEPKRLSTTDPPPSPTGTVAMVARTPLIPNYPCSRCHVDRQPNPTERRLTDFHTQKILLHGSQKGWCYRCHDQEDIDRLRLQDGTLVTFDEAYELCGSCHGDKYRDFNSNLHGLTTGDWRGRRERRSCTACHDPHNPHFPAMTPEKPPQRPRTAQAKSHEASEDSDGEGH